MKHQPEIAIDPQDNALADSPQFAHHVVLDTGQRRLRGAQQERARQPHPLQRLADDACFKRAEISRNIGQFGHVYQLARRACNLARSEEFCGGIRFGRL